MKKFDRLVFLCLASALLWSPALAGQVEEPVEPKLEAREVKNKEESEVTDKASDETEGKLKAEDMVSIVENSIDLAEDGKLYLILKLKNDSKERLTGTLALEKIGNEDISRYFIVSDTIKYDLKPGETVDLKFELKLKDDLAKGDYPILVSINFNNILVTETIEVSVPSLDLVGSDKDPGNLDPSKLPGAGAISGDHLTGLTGGQHMGSSGSYPQVDTSGLIVDGGGDFSSVSPSAYGDNVNAQGQPVKNKPKLIVEQYSFDPKHPLAGDDFTMSLSFFNTNQDKSVRNIKISLTSSEGAANPVAGALGQAQPTNEVSNASSVFTPVGTSNTFYIDRIDPKQKISKSVKLTTPASLPTKNYSLIANFEYEDYDGNQYVAQETIGIPVVQESKLTSSDVVVPKENYVGEKIEGEVQFYNTGKDTLNNLMVKVEGDFDDMSLEEYIGNFASGESSSYYFNLTPKATGKQKGKIIFRYEDAVGQSQTVEKDFEVFVAEGAPAGPEDQLSEEEMAALESGGISPLLIGALVLAAGGLGAFIYKKKKKTNKEKDLTLDED